MSYSSSCVIAFQYAAWVESLFLYLPALKGCSYLWALSCSLVGWRNARISAQLNNQCHVAGLTWCGSIYRLHFSRCKAATLFRGAPCAPAACAARWSMCSWSSSKPRALKTWYRRCYLWPYRIYITQKIAHHTQNFTYSDLCVLWVFPKMLLFQALRCVLRTFTVLHEPSPKKLRRGTRALDAPGKNARV